MQQGTEVHICSFCSTVHEQPKIIIENISVDIYLFALLIDII